MECKFLDKIISLIKYGVLETPPDDLVIDFLHPNDLENEIDFSLGQPTDEKIFLSNICKDLIKRSVKTQHRHFYNQLYGGVDGYGLAGAWLSESLNTNQHTFEVAPVFSLAEKYVIEHVIKKAGLNDGDGIFAPGGSISNMYGLVLARYKLFPNVKKTGLSNLPVLVAFTSEDGHYSLDKSVHWLGIGTDNLIKIKTDSDGHMVPQMLEAAIEKTISEGKVPFFVNATAGTTVLGAFDPLNVIADICTKYNLWFHVDACYGGTLLLSNRYKCRLDGIHKADSFAWNAHKMLGAPLQCSLFVTKHKNLLQQCNAASADYLFQKDKFYDISYDTGDKSIQCGRKIDAFKLWMMWKIRGDSGFERLINNAMDCSIYFKNKIKRLPGFRLVKDEFESASVCFWYVPKKMRGLTESEDWWKEINRVAPAIKERMMKKGVLMIGYTPLSSKGLCNFFRLVVTCHSPSNHEDMDFVIEQIQTFGESL